MERFFEKRNSILNISDKEVINAFHRSLTYTKELFNKITLGKPATSAELMKIVNTHIDVEEAQRAQYPKQDARVKKMTHRRLGSIREPLRTTSLPPTSHNLLRMHAGASCPYPRL